jgi:hypothetical protein
MTFVIEIANEIRKIRDSFFCCAGEMSIHAPTLPHPIVGNNKTGVIGCQVSQKICQRSMNMSYSLQHENVLFSTQALSGECPAREMINQRSPYVMLGESKRCEATQMLREFAQTTPKNIIRSQNICQNIKKYRNPEAPKNLCLLGKSFIFCQRFS